MTEQYDHVKKKTSFPWRHVIGYVLSIVLTLLALWVALYTGLPVFWKLVIIFSFAIFQASVQLILFMHMTETSDSLSQTITMLHALLIFVIIVAGSVWVMVSVLMY